MTIVEAVQITEDAALIDENLQIGIQFIGGQFVVNIRDIQTPNVAVAYRQLISVKQEICA